MRRMSAETPTPDQIAKLTSAANWSQSEMAYRLGVTQGAVSRWMSGAASMKAAYWWFLRADIAADLGVFAWPPPTMDELMLMLKRRR